MQKAIYFKPAHIVKFVGGWNGNNEKSLNLELFNRRDRMETRLA